MSSPVVHRLVAGETLSFELRFVGEDLTDAVASVEVSGGLDAGDFTTQLFLPDIVRVVASDTSGFPVGVHVLDVWLDFPGGEIDRENFRSLVDVSASAGAL